MADCPCGRSIGRRRALRDRLAVHPQTLGPGLALILRRTVQIVAVLFCLGILGWRCEQTVEKAWDITDLNITEPMIVEVGQFARDRLPANAVLFYERRIVDERRIQLENEHLTLTFYADRTCYSLDGDISDNVARQVIEAGGIPYLVSHRYRPLPEIYVCHHQGSRVYLWQSGRR